MIPRWRNYLWLKSVLRVFKGSWKKMSCSSVNYIYKPSEAIWCPIPSGVIYWHTQHVRLHRSCVTFKFEPTRKILLKDIMIQATCNQAGDLNATICPHCLEPQEEREHINDHTRIVVPWHGRHTIHQVGWLVAWRWSKWFKGMWCVWTLPC